MHDVACVRMAAVEFASVPCELVTSSGTMRYRNERAPDSPYERRREDRRSGRSIGSASYMSPEQRRDSRSTTAPTSSRRRALLPLLPGQKPFDGTGWAPRKKNHPGRPGLALDAFGTSRRLRPRRRARAAKGPSTASRRGQFRESLKRLAPASRPGMMPTWRRRRP